MKTIGLVGGIASGKSLVAKMLVELGAVHLDADRTGHEVLADDAEARDAIIRRWGDAVLGPDGRVDRAAIARHVFAKTDSGATDRKFLEDLLHPRIRVRLNAEREKAAAAGVPAVVLDAPLLLEAGWKPLCDVVLMIDTPRESRLKWAAARGWSESEFDQREAAQMPVDEKRGLADFVISNGRSADDLRQAVTEFWSQQIAGDAHNP